MSPYTENLTVPRDITGIDGGLAATEAADGVTLELTNLHGDIVGTCGDSTTSSLDTYEESTEYGQPRDAVHAYTMYGWHGASERSSNSLGGLLFMGVRLYSTTSGRFLSVDSVAGGNANAYIYPQDPINDDDLTGKCTRHTSSCVISMLTTNEPFPPGFITWLKTHKGGNRSNPVRYGNTKAGYRWMRNGDHCTDSEDTDFFFNFKNACDVHDLGYDLMEYMHYKGAKSAVDSIFYHDMKADCNDRFFINKSMCRTRAYAYYQAVKRFGDP
jgi:RHS repeat-associated protein